MSPLKSLQMFPTTHQSPSTGYPALHNLVQSVLLTSFSTTFFLIHSAQITLVYSCSSSKQEKFRISDMLCLA